MNRIRSARGSVLMEYLILNMVIGVGMAVLMSVGFYNFDEGYTEYEDQGGIKTFDKRIYVFQDEDLEITLPGIRIKQYFQRILTGIALPIP